MALQRVITEKYVLVKAGVKHPGARPDGYVYEHRFIAEGLLGRRLTRNEAVHHIDGDRFNNSPENLQIMTIGEHSKLHMALLRPERIERKAKKKAEKEALRIQKKQARLDAMIDDERLTKFRSVLINSYIAQSCLADKLGVNRTTFNKQIHGSLSMSISTYENYIAAFKELLASNIRIFETLLQSTNPTSAPTNGADDNQTSSD